MSTEFLVAGMLDLRRRDGIHLKQNIIRPLAHEIENLIRNLFLFKECTENEKSVSINIWKKETTLTKYAYTDCLHSNYCHSGKRWSYGQLSAQFSACKKKANLKLGVTKKKIEGVITLLY